MTQLYKKVNLFSFVIGILFCFQNAYSQSGRLPTKQELDTKMALEQLYKNPSFTSQKGGAPNHIMITGPEQDCDNAIPVCTQSYTQSSSYTGHGTIQEVNGTCLSTQETNSVWYVFTVQNSGTFTFMLNTANDYDFALYNITTIGCVGVPSAVPIRCNFSATYGSTGLTLPAAGGNLSYNASQAPTMAGINVTAGQTFVLIVDNYSANSNGYTLSFGGSAQIFDNIPPTITSSTYACFASSFNVNFSEPVLCSSISSNGSNFTITGPSGSVPVTSAVGNLCSTGASNTNFATVNFNNAGLQTGTYTISVGNGVSGPIKDKCGNNLAPQTLTFQYFAPITVSVSNPSVCAGISSTLTVNGTNGASGITYNWSPVSGSTGTLVVNPNVNTTYVVTATYGGCTRSASGSVSITLPPVVSVNPSNASLCSGTTNILASSTSGGSPCLNCTYNWSGSSTQTNVAVPNSTVTNAGAGTYSVTVVSNDGCIGNTAVANVSILSPAASPACNIIYVSPAGGGSGLIPSSPTDIQTALTLGACNSVVIKMQIGDYTINNPLNMGSFSTIEGGYNTSFTDKTSAKATAGGFPAQGTRIIRSTANLEGTTGFFRYTALNISPSSSYFRIQDIRIDMPDNAAGTGISNYGIYLGSGSNNYNITRCYIYSGNAGSGATGATGATGAAGTVGSTGSNASVGYTSPAGNSGAGGAGGGASGGAGGAAKIFSGTGAGTVGNNGITFSTAQGGGGGASGGTGGRNASAATTGGAGGSGFSGIAGGTAGPGSTINTSSGCAFSAMTGGVGTNGTNGSVGTPAGTAGVGSDASGYWNSASGTSGTFGTGGSGGGGGGGGGTGFNSNTSAGCASSYGTGAGGGGGGGGGQGGFGGGGGTGGGSTYGIFIFNNGASGNVVDCQIINGLAGAGGLGGPGGPGGPGGIGGNGGTTGAVYVGAGGKGGDGGAGGAGSSGGAGCTGLAVPVKVVGGSALAVNTTINMLTQPVITVNNIACTSVPIAHSTAAGSPSWTSFGGGSAPASGAGSPVNTTYSTLGRKTVVMNANNYTDFNNIIVTAPSTGSIVASATSICPGSANFASTAIGTAGLNYSWSVLPAGATISSASTSSTSVLFPNTGASAITYTVTLTITSNCCGALVPVTTTIVVNPIPAAPTGTVNPMCIGGTATYSATAPIGNSFSWYNAASSGTLLATGNTYSVANITTPNTVYLQTTNSAGCSSTLTPVVVTPTAVPPPTVVPGSACDIGSVQVSINPASGVTDYNWYSNPGGTTLIQTGNSLNYSQNIPTAGGSYTVYVQSTIPGCSPSSLVPVSGSVSATPITLAQTISPNDTVCFNTPVTFSLNAGGGNGTFTYSWSPVTSAASVLSQTASVSTSYEVTISSNGCSKLFYLPLIVNPVPKDTIGLPLSISCSNPTITLDGSFSASGSNITYNWTTTGGNIISPTTSNTVSVNASGNYTLLVTNTITGCSSTQTVAVNGSSALPSLTLTASSNTLTCATPTIQLNASTSTSGVTYSWTTVGGTLSSTNTANPVATASGTYIVVVTNTTTGCQSTQSLVVVPDAAIPTVSVSANSLSITCTNTTVTTALTSTSTISSYNWSPSPVSGGANPVFDTPGTYNATVTANNGCSTNVSVNVALDNTPPVISLSSSVNSGTITCTNTLVTITPTITPSTNLTYTWSPSGVTSSTINDASFSSAGVYTLAITNTLTGCVTSSTNTANTFTVIVDNTTPTATITTSSTNTVIGCGAGNSTVTLSSAITSTNSTTISWLPSTAITPTLDVTTAGIYTLVVTDAVTGCSVTTQYTVNGNTTPPQNVDAGASTSVGCGTSTVSLLGSTSSTASVSYSWAGPSGTSIVSGTETTASPVVTEVGQYTVTVTDNLTGCQNTDTVNVTLSIATASISANPTTGTSPLDVAFTGNGLGAPSFNWNFGDGNTSSNQNPNNVFTTGTYTVVLTTTSGSCTATATVVIIVEDGLTLEIPNVFTPNGDNTNDVFTIKSTGVKEITLQIFNRWGQKLYEFTGPKASWDGLSPSGAKAPEGTYFYFVIATGFDNKEIKQNGTVNLFR